MYTYIYIYIYIYIIAAGVQHRLHVGELLDVDEAADTTQILPLIQIVTTTTTTNNNNNTDNNKHNNTDNNSTAPDNYKSDTNHNDNSHIKNNAPVVEVREGVAGQLADLADGAARLLSMILITILIII